MGWLRDSGEAWSYDHEGFIVAVEKVDDRWREITPADAHRGEIDVSHVQVACDCGWRSQRLVAPIGTTWAPCSVFTDAATDDLAYGIWADEHRNALTERSSNRLLYVWPGVAHG